KAAETPAPPLPIGPDESPRRKKRPAKRASQPSYEAAASRLHGDAERLFTHGQYPEAERKVRKLLGLQKRVVGRHHPDFALGLAMLGELRFLQDDLEGAEAQFRRALAVRGRVLGHHDPDYAV